MTSSREVGMAATLNSSGPDNISDEPKDAENFNLIF